MLTIPRSPRRPWRRAGLVAIAAVVFGSLWAGQMAMASLWADPAAQDDEMRLRLERIRQELDAMLRELDSDRAPPPALPADQGVVSTLMADPAIQQAIQDDLATFAPPVAPRLLPPDAPVAEPLLLPPARPVHPVDPACVDAPPIARLPAVDPSAIPAPPAIVEPPNRAAVFAPLPEAPAIALPPETRTAPTPEPLPPFTRLAPVPELLPRDTRLAPLPDNPLAATRAEPESLPRFTRSAPPTRLAPPAPPALLPPATPHRASSDRIERVLDRAVEAGELTPEERDQVLRQLRQKSGPLSRLLPPANRPAPTAVDPARLAPLPAATPSRAAPPRDRPARGTRLRDLN